MKDKSSSGGTICLFVAGGWVAPEVPYTISDQQVKSVSPSVPVPTGIWRSVAFSYTTFAIEGFYDEVAIATGADSYNFRYQMADSERLKAVIKLAAEKAGWGAPLPAGQGRGIAACAFGFESTKTYVAQVAEVSVSDSGNVRVQRVVCAFDCGTTVNPDIVETRLKGESCSGCQRRSKARSRWQTDRYSKATSTITP